MNHRNRPIPILIATLTLAAPALAAGDERLERPFTVEFSVGAEYDSNVAVLELDTSSGEGDTAALIDFGLGFDKDVTEWLEIKLGYNLSQTLHDNFDAFDLRIHRGSGELAFDLGGVDAGLGYQHADAALDGNGFLVLKRTAPYLGRLFKETLFLRLEYAATDKEFDSDPARDASADAWSLDGFVFVDGVKHYWIFGYQSQDEDAAEDEFDYTGSRLKLQYVRRLGGNQRIKLKTGLRYETRDYDAPQLVLGGPRQDDRRGFEAELEWPVKKRGYLRTRYEYNDNESNLTSVDFDEQVVSVELGWKF